MVEGNVSGRSAPGAHRWVMWVFLWEDGVLRELAAITGAGKRYDFKDLNGDGSLEFVNQEGGVCTCPNGRRLHRLHRGSIALMVKAMSLLLRTEEILSGRLVQQLQIGGSVFLLS